MNNQTKQLWQAGYKMQALRSWLRVKKAQITPVIQLFSFAILSIAGLIALWISAVLTMAL